MKPFKTFFMAGYECADMINNRRQRVDLLQATGHDQRVEEDYALLAATGISTVREGIRWSVVEKEPYRYDFTEVKARIEAAKKHGLQQLWDICHFGYPNGLNPLEPDFTDRFVAVCKAFTEVYRFCTDDPLIVTPINEISFLSWLSGDVEGTVPFLRHSGAAVKYGLCKAAIKSIEAIKAVDPSAKIMMVEPLIRVHPRANEPALKRIKECNEGQYEAMDIITGRMYPELGGRPEYMDLAGFNYYYNNQWEHEGRRVVWNTERERCDFPGLLKTAADRYKVPVLLSETGHFKEDRPLWIKQITEDCITAMKNGVDLQGICIYPVIDRPDWDTFECIPCGVWGYDEQSKKRVVEIQTYQALLLAIKQMDDYINSEKVLAQQPTEVLAA